MKAGEEKSEIAVLNLGTPHSPQRFLFYPTAILLHVSNVKIGVTGYANAEQRMWIVEATGDVLIEQPETSRSGCRETASNPR